MVGEKDRFWEGDGFGMEMDCMREKPDALWEGHTLLKTGLSAHRWTHTHTHTQK